MIIKVHNEETMSRLLELLSRGYIITEVHGQFYYIAKL
jgi:hypothetical protein